jgi:drug/metabolite transporter (DMT)-like permease
MIINAKLSDLDPRASMGAALVVAAIVLTPATAIGPAPEIPTTEALIALIVLGVLCTAAAFTIYALLVTEVGPGRAVIITYVAPVVAVAAGIAVLDESLGPGAILGLVLILAGSWLATGGLDRAARGSGREAEQPRVM